MSGSRKRRERHASRTQWFIVATVIALIAVAVVRLAPARHEQPLVTVFMRSDCDSCRRWMRHLNASGFRTRAGHSDEWIAVRKDMKVPPGFDVPHHAIVQGLFIAGHVPARDIHRALRSPERDAIRGLVVPGAPPGAPGIEAALKRPYMVFAVDARGLLRPWATHNHSVH